MRVLYFTRDFTPHDHRFLTSLAESEQEVFFLRLERRGRQLEDRPLPPEVRQIPWRGGQQPFRWRAAPGLVSALRGVIAEVQPDVLHAGPIQTVAFLAALSGFRPLVSMSWGSDMLKDAQRSAAYRWITRYTLRKSAALVGDCQAVREKAIALGVSNEKIFTFPWGIDLQRFAPLAKPASSPLRERLGWQDCFVVLSLRSWEPVYGVDVMLRGFADAARQNNRLRLLLLGGGSQAGLVHRIIQEEGLEDVVYLGGQVNQQELPELYHAADLYVSASHSDGSSVSLMEALGCGLPCLVTDIPSNREWVTADQEGWLFPDSADQVLSKSILQVAALAEQASLDFARIRQAARARAEQRANWDENFQTLRAAYRYALNGSFTKGAR